jgi:hypothetical protein
MYIAELNIVNIRVFEETRLEFVHPETRAADAPRLRNVNLLLGDNGAGKTSVLRSVALALLGDALQFSGFRPYRLIRRIREWAPKVAFVKMSVVDDQLEHASPDSSPEVSVILERRGDQELVRATTPGSMDEALFDEHSPAFFLAGYGATRRVETSDRFDLGAQEKARGLRYRRVATLFEEHVGLTPMSLWLPRLQAEAPARFAEVAELLDRLLGGYARFTGQQEEGDYLFEIGDTLASFPALSDGFRAYIGWIADLLYHMQRVCPKEQRLTALDGIVMVDEIDLHLHPEWQREVVPRISEALPRMQFILTTHSPIVTGTLEAGNIWQIGAEPGQASTARRLQERVHGLSAEQILLGSYFNLASTRAPGAVDELLRLSKQVRTGDTEAALDTVRLLAEGLPDAPATATPEPLPTPQPAGVIELRPRTKASPSTSSSTEKQHKSAKKATAKKTTKRVAAIAAAAKKATKRAAVKTAATKKAATRAATKRTTRRAAAKAAAVKAAKRR